MMSRWSGGFRFAHRDIEVMLYTPRRGWPGWCLGLALRHQRSGRGDGTAAKAGHNSGGPSVLLAYGPDDAVALARSGLV